MTANDVIRLLGLVPLPGEGGWYVETYRADLVLSPDALGAPWRAPRSASTAIYYLLTADTCSRMHRLPGDEVFHFHLGDPLDLLVLLPGGESRVHRLGTDLAAGQRPQVVVPGGAWQGSRLAPWGTFCLVGTTMAPGFDFADYEAGDCDALAAAWPEEAGRIRLRS